VCLLLYKNHKIVNHFQIMWNKVKNMRYLAQRKLINNPYLSFLLLILTFAKLAYIIVKSSTWYYAWMMIFRCIWSVILWVCGVLEVIFGGITPGMVGVGFLLIFACLFLFMAVSMMLLAGWIVWREYIYIYRPSSNT